MNYRSDAAEQRLTRFRGFVTGLWWAAAAVGLLASARADDSEWIKLTAPQFTVLSEVSESRTRAWAREFELFHRGIASVLWVPPERLEPLRVVLFRSDRRFRPYKPLAGGKPAEVNGVFLHEPERNLAALAVDGLRDETREHIFHEATHWHLAAYERDLPLWLNEGLAELFGNFEVRGDTFMLGKIRPSYLKYVHTFTPLSYRELASIDEGALAYDWHHSAQTTKFYAESWAAAHLLALDTPSGMSILRRYLHAPAGAALASDELLGYFGITPAQFDQRLSVFLMRRRVNALVVPLDRHGLGENYVVQPATSTEIDLALGELLLGENRLAEAKPYIARVVAARPDDPVGLAKLGEIAVGEKRNDEADCYLRRALAHGSTSFRVYFFVAMATWAERRSDGKVSVESMSKAMEYLTNALMLNPRLASGYEAAGAMMLDATTPALCSRLEALVQEGERRFPKSAGLLIGRGVAALRLGDYAQARACAAKAGSAPSTMPELTHLAQSRLLDEIAIAEARSQAK